MPIGGVNDEHFSCFHSLFQCGLKTDSKKNLTKKCIEFGSLFIISNHTQNKFNETDFGACAGVNTKLPTKQ